MNGLIAPIAHRETVTASPSPPIGRTAEDRIRASGYLALREVSCSASDGVAYLHGCLPSHYLKQLAQEIAGGVQGVRVVVNRIEVLRPARTSRARTDHTAQVIHSF
jgi:osmotically-inducible protein OsmY